MIGMFKGLVAVSLVLMVAACTGPTADLAKPAVPLGDFRLGHNIAVARSPQLVPGSRKATEAEWQKAMTDAIEERFGRYEGSALYHFGISIDAYNLAAIDVPGIPTPKSALGVTVTIWDDAKGKKLNPEAKQITVLGVFSGTGIQPTKEVQLENLSQLAAKSIQKWLLENPDWFNSNPEAEPIAKAPTDS